MEAKGRAGRRTAYTTTLREHLNIFAKGREQAPISAIGQTEVAAFLDGKGGTASSRSTRLSRISTLLSYAVRQGWATSNPCDHIERVSVERKPPAILTPAQATKLLAAVRDRRLDALAFVALAMFAGLRPDELARIGWESVDLDRKLVVVDSSASKVRQRRLIPISDTEVRWLRLGGDLPFSSRVLRSEHLS